MPKTAINPEMVENFGRLMRENITTGDIPFRKTYIRAVVDRIEISDDVVRIIGDKTKLEKAVTWSHGSVPGVRSFAPEWRSLGEGAPQKTST